MKTDWGHRDITALHELGFHWLDKGEIYGTWGVWLFSDIKRYRKAIIGGFSNKELAQAYIDSLPESEQGLAQIRYTHSLEEELTDYLAGLQAGIVPHYSLAQLVDFRDRPETLALAIQDIQDRISFLQPEPLVREWVEYQRSLGKKE